MAVEKKGKEIEKEQSIIQIIQQMVAAGEPEEKIITTLKDLGVEPEQAKRLLLIGQADTFAILRNEIHKIVLEDIDKEKTNINRFIESEATRTANQKSSDAFEKIKRDIDNYTKEMTGKEEQFQGQINETIEKVKELSDRVRIKLNELGGQTQQVRLDLDELKLSGVGKRNSAIGLTVMGLGVIFMLLTLYQFANYFLTGALTFDALIFTVVFAFIGIASLVVSTLL